MRSGKNETVVVSALRRANFGKLLRRVEDERRSLVIEKRGRPKAVLLGIRDYLRLAAPEPEVLRVVVSAALKPSGLQRTVLLLAISKPAKLYLTGIRLLVASSPTAGNCFVETRR